MIGLFGVEHRAGSSSVRFAFRLSLVPRGLRVDVGVSFLRVGPRGFIIADSSFARLPLGPGLNGGSRTTTPTLELGGEANCHGREEEHPRQEQGAQDQPNNQPTDRRLYTIAIFEPIDRGQSREGENQHKLVINAQNVVGDRGERSHRDFVDRDLLLS